MSMMAMHHSYHPRLHPNLGLKYADSPDAVDLQAALMADPDNAEAKAMLHARSQTIDKLLASTPAAATGAATATASPQTDFAQPFSRQLERISIEIWREVALFLPRRDLKTLLFVPHILSRVASQLLFRELDLHFTGGDYGYNGGGESDDEGGGHRDREHLMSDDRERDEGRHAQRTADILTRLIVDQKFANAVRTLKIYCSRSDRDGTMAFQTGMLTNVLPKLTNLKNMYLSAPSESIVPVLRILQTTGTRLLGLSLHSPDAPADLSFLELRNLSHFSYTTSGGTLVCITPLLSLSRTSLSSLHLENTHTSPSPHWSFPITYVSIRNLTSLNFTGHFSKEQGSNVMGEILRDGRQLVNLAIVCCALDSGGLSREFKGASTGWSSSGAAMSTGMQQHVTLNSNGTPVALPFLQNFSFIIQAIGRRTSDRELFGSIADFLRGRRGLKSLKLVVSCDEHVQAAVGFSAAVWGVLPSLEGLRGLSITYPQDLTPGLASWLIPRGVRALALSLDYANATTRDPVPFLSGLRQGMPPELKFIGLSELNVRHASLIVEQGFPTVRVVRVGQNYWTVHRRKYTAGPGYTSLASSPPTTHTARPILPSMTSHRSSVGLSGPGSSAGMTTSASSSSASTPRGALSPISHPAERTLASERDLHRSGSSILLPSSVQSNDRLMHIRPLTHTGHPHSGHTHGHPGSSNPHPPHGHAHILNPAPGGPPHGHGDGSGRGGSGGDGRGGYGGGHHGMGPPSGTSGLMSSGILSGPGGPGAAGHGAAVIDLEPWPRRTVLYHAAEWLEWLGCEDALVRDQSAFPAWVSCL